jgi:hypothetical protein
MTIKNKKTGTNVIAALWQRKSRAGNEPQSLKKEE